MKVVAVVLARLDSKRLPGKALREVRGRALIDYVLDACAGAAVDDVVLATTDRAIDDRLAVHAQARGIGVFRGSTDDVAGRFLGALIAAGADAGLRVNGDSPLHRAVLLAEGVRLWRESGVDLVSNVPGRTWPFGWSVEVVSTAAMKRAHAAMGSAEHREHVTKFLYDEPAGFSRLVLAPGPAGGSGLQLAVDDEADLARFEGLLDQWHGDLSNAAPTTVIAAALAQGCGASP